MSKYPDINKAHAEFFGEGWHLENHPESIVGSNQRKHKKCRFLIESGTCKNFTSNHYNRICVSKSHCSYYKA